MVRFFVPIFSFSFILFSFLSFFRTFFACFCLGLFLLGFVMVLTEIFYA